MRTRTLSVFFLFCVTTFARDPTDKQKETPVQAADASAHTAVKNASAKTGASTSPEKTSNAEAPESSGAAPLSVKKVVLYKNGVGYFEHTGHVRGNQDVGIEFTTAQLNDVLKSLTLVDLNGGRISGVRYNSVAPLGERLKSLQIPVSEEVTSAAFLIALRGAAAEARSGAAVATRDRCWYRP